MTRAPFRYATSRKDPASYAPSPRIDLIPDIRLIMRPAAAASPPVLPASSYEIIS